MTKIFHKKLCQAKAWSVNEQQSFYGLSLIAFGSSIGQVAVAVEQKPEGIEGSTFNLLNRNLYFNRDYRNGQSNPTGKSAI